MMLRWLARYTSGSPVGKADGMRVLGRLMLDQKNAVYMVKVVNSILVVGVGPNTIQLLSEIDEPKLVALVETETGGGDIFGVPSFYSHLRSFVNRYRGGGESLHATQGGVGEKPIMRELSNIRRQIERLRKQSRDM